MKERTHLLRTQLDLPLSRDAVFAFFSAAENLGRITPPELAFKILTPLPVAMKPGALIEYSIGLWMIPLRWHSKITLWRPPAAFVDEQLSGPYAEWVHTHTFTEIEGGTRIVDEVRYRLPFGLMGRMAHPLVRMQLRRIFSYRQRRVRELLLGTAGGAAAVPELGITFR